jgi:hypothetical protein
MDNERCPSTEPRRSGDQNEALIAAVK